jgi:hypothetical protein
VLIFSRWFDCKWITGESKCTEFLGFQ